MSHVAEIGNSYIFLKLQTRKKRYFKKSELLRQLSNHSISQSRGYSLTENTKQNNLSNFWPQKCSRSLKNFKQWSLARAFKKRFLSEKQNVYLQSARLRDS